MEKKILNLICFAWGFVLESWKFLVFLFAWAFSSHSLEITQGDIGEYEILKQKRQTSCIRDFIVNCKITFILIL